MFDAATLRNTLVVRTDRIGDVLLTVPMAGAVKRLAPEARVTFLVREYTRPLLHGHPHIDNVLAVGSESDLPSTLTELRKHQFTAVFCPSPSLTVARTMKQANIPVRVGTAYRWYAWMFTEKIREHRKYAARHEVQYNIRMLDGSAMPTPETDPSVITLSPEARAAAATWLHERGLTGQTFVVVHPGSGGSAKDLPAERFAHIVARIGHELGAPVLITGTAQERMLLRRVQSMAGTHVLEAVDLPLDVLAAIVAHAACLVSNSTGMLHIAVAVGTFALGAYPPIVACSPRRWGPWSSFAAVLEPQIDQSCGDCAEASCVFHDCMRLIGVEELMNVVRARVVGARTGRVQ